MSAAIEWDFLDHRASFVFPDGCPRRTSTRGYLEAFVLGRWRAEHILAAERARNGPLGTGEIVHHALENKGDARVEALQVIADREHRRHHYVTLLAHTTRRNALQRLTEEHGIDGDPELIRALAEEEVERRLCTWVQEMDRGDAGCGGAGKRGENSDERVIIIVDARDDPLRDDRALAEQHRLLRSPEALQEIARVLGVGGPLPFEDDGVDCVT